MVPRDAASALDGRDGASKAAPLRPISSGWDGASKAAPLWAIETHLHRGLDQSPLLHRKLQRCLYSIDITTCIYYDSFPLNITPQLDTSNRLLEFISSSLNSTHIVWAHLWHLPPHIVPILISVRKKRKISSSLVMKIGLTSRVCQVLRRRIWQRKTSPLQWLQSQYWKKHHGIRELTQTMWAKLCLVEALSGRHLSTCYSSE